MLDCKYIISLDASFDAIEVHIIVQKPFGRIYTLLTDQIRTTNAQKLLEWIKVNNFKELVDYFKHKYDIIHSEITFSYGPRVRDIIRKNNINKNYSEER